MTQYFIPKEVYKIPQANIYCFVIGTKFNKNLICPQVYCCHHEVLIFKICNGVLKITVLHQSKTIINSTFRNTITQFEFYYLNIYFQIQNKIRSLCLKFDVVMQHYICFEKNITLYNIYILRTRKVIL